MVECKKGDHYNNSRRVYSKHYGVELNSNDFVMHSCDHRWCVEITHLSLGTNSDNQIDMMKKKRYSTKIVKLSEKDVRKIKEMGGMMSQREIAKLFGVSRQNINMILNNRIWKWVD